jgi:hypothetical protein
MGTVSTAMVPTTAKLTINSDSEKPLFELK